MRSVKGATSRVVTLKAQPRQHMDPTKWWWASPGPDLPEGSQLIAGPLGFDRGRFAQIQLLVDATVHVNPAMRLAELRPMTEDDERLLDKVNELDFKSSGAREVKQDLEFACNSIKPGHPLQTGGDRRPALDLDERRFWGNKL